MGDTMFTISKYLWIVRCALIAGSLTVLVLSEAAASTVIGGSVFDLQGNQ